VRWQIAAFTGLRATLTCEPSVTKQKSRQTDSPLVRIESVQFVHHGSPGIG
jgi:hypothetical protein